jgi:hypothetical protein
MRVRSRFSSGAVCCMAQVVAVAEDAQVRAVGNAVAAMAVAPATVAATRVVGGATRAHPEAVKATTATRRLPKGAPMSVAPGVAKRPTVRRHPA